jgi:hypothetical protein
MSRSREDRAEDLLRVAELAARNLELDLDDGDDDGAQEMKKELARAATRIRYLKARASAQWFAKFERVIDGSHSMRVRKLEAAEAKDSMRLTDGKCMACGRVEHNCVYAIDLAGIGRRSSHRLHCLLVGVRGRFHGLPVRARKAALTRQGHVPGRLDLPAQGEAAILNADLPARALLRVGARAGAAVRDGQVLARHFLHSRRRGSGAAGRRAGPPRARYCGRKEACARDLRGRRVLARS